MAHRRKSDHFARRAKREGYAARSVFKLEEIDRKYTLLRPGQRVVDLGCAPGSWLKFIAQKVGAKGRVVGIDRVRVDVGGHNIHTLVGDVFDTSDHVFFDAAGGLFDVVTSDMAPDTCGNRFTDHVRSIELCRRAAGVAETLLRRGGHFVCKVFEGPDLADFVMELRGQYQQVKRYKPKATRSESVELFVIARTKKHEATITVDGSETAGGTGR